MIAILVGSVAFSDEACLCTLSAPSSSPSSEMVGLLKPIDEAIIAAQVFSNIDEAVAAQKKFKKPVREFETMKKTKFPSYSECEKTFFRVATTTYDIDKIITAKGWLSGYERGESGNALSPKTPIEDRVIQYVGVKGEHLPFPRNSTIVGVMEDPVRTLSVGWHTGYTTDPQKYMRMDELEIGSCAKAPECRNIKMVDSSKVFEEDRKVRAAQGKPPRYSRYSTEGEWAVDLQIPPACIVATYRVKYQKVDGVNYSGSY